MQHARAALSIELMRVGPIAPGATATADFAVGTSSFLLFDAAGNETIWSGRYTVVISRGGAAAPDEVRLTFECDDAGGGGAVTCSRV